MTTAPLRRAVRAALTLFAAALLPLQAGAQQIISGTTQVTPANTSSFEFQGGTLQDVGGGTYTNAVSIDPNFNGTIDANGKTSVWSGIFSGTGNLLTLTDGAGGGMITLSGANTYTGVTALNSVKVGFAGASAFGTGSLSMTGSTLINANGGAATLANNILLNSASAANVFDANGHATTLSGTIFGAGGVTLQNSGGSSAQINLTGTSYYTGATTVVTNNLTLGVAASGFGAGPISFDGSTALQTVGAANLSNTISLGPNASALTVDADGNNSTFSGAITGSGGMTFVDSTGHNDVVTLSGSGSSWSGGTIIGDGTNAVTVALGGLNGLSPNSALTVAPNGTFNMSGFNQQINAAVANNGTIETGAGTLSVTGGYTAGSGSALGVFPVLTGPNLSATGAATLTGETLFVEQRPASGSYQIVDAAGGFGGTVFTNASCPTGTTAAAGLCLPTGYIGSVSYAANEVTLSLTAPSLIVPGQTRNQAAIAGALNATNAAGSLDMAAVLAQVNTLAFTSVSQLNEALDEMSPIHYAALSGLSQAGAGAQMEAVNRRVNSLQAGLADVRGEQVAYYDAGGRSPYPGPLVAEGGGGPVPAAAPPVNPLDNPWAIYASGLYASGRLDGINGAAGYQPGYGFNSYGGMMGTDYRFSDEFAAGVTAGYVSGRANFTGLGGQASNNSLLFGAYAATWSGAFHGSLYLGTASDSFTTSRNIPDFGRTATASPSGSEFRLDASGGWDIKEGRALLSPYADFSYAHQHVNGFSESGAGALDLNVGPFGTNSLRTTFGTKLSRKFAGDGWSLTPSLNAGWEHEFADQSRAIDAQFSTGGGAFSVDTADVARDALAAGVALTSDLGEYVSLRLGYSGDYRRDFSARTADFSVRVRF
jgi:uncharacterized protein with beta-barrel porin domain